MHDADRFDSWAFGPVADGVLEQSRALVGVDDHGVQLEQAKATDFGCPSTRVRETRGDSVRLDRQRQFSQARSQGCQMIIRVRHPAGTTRLDLDVWDDVPFDERTVARLVLRIGASEDLALSWDQAGRRRLGDEALVASLGLAHGDLLFANLRAAQASTSADRPVRPPDAPVTAQLVESDDDIISLVPERPQSEGMIDVERNAATVSTPIALPYHGYGAVTQARQLTRREQFILACHSHGACVSFLAVLDGVQLGLGMCDTPALLCLAWGPLAGWCAGRHFSVRWLVVYGLFYMLKVAYSV